MRLLAKRFFTLSTVAFFLLSIVSPLAVVQAASNLIANPSVETSVQTVTPANWTFNSWGENSSTGTYANDGYSGSHSLLITMANRTSGDAKWLHDAVTVTPNTSYTYSSYYKSSVDTEIDLQYTSSTGAVSYAYALYVPASTNWKELSTTFVTPANVSKVTVLHIIANAGTLQTDDFSLSTTITAPPATSDNFIGNPSFEVANGAVPAGWQKNSWGSNSTQFAYEASGRTGSRSVTVKMTQYSSGDAKWFADPVSIATGKSYTYRGYYKSSVSTRVVVAFIAANGTYTYTELPTGAPASSSWSEYSASFTAPATAAKATVYHLLSSVGYLTIDDVSLANAAPADIANVPNGSLEQVSNISTMPASWQKSSWGTNTPTFAYLSNGRTGTKSVKVTIKNYTSGDAKWFFDPITSLKAGQQYKFTTWYKTNAKAPRVVALFIDQAGLEHYVGMQNALPSGSTTAWQQYSDTFIVPTGTVSVSVFMLLAENGWLQTDDYSITDYVATGFNRPLLTLTFDDGHEDNVYTALPLLNQYGFRSTQCFATTFIEGDQTAINNVKTFFNAGHEICSHTVTHPFLTKVTTANLTYELSHSQQVLQSITGAPVKNFASPYGDYNATVISAIKKYYQSHRTVDAGFNSKDNFDAYRLRVQNVLDTTTAQQIQQWVEQAKKDNTWLILLYHRVADNPGTYDTYTSTFAQHLEAIKASGITVKTYQDALTEVKTQL